jgi:predicted DNA-binding protein with PD1-like motif
MGARGFTTGRRVVARLEYGGDLLEQIAAVADAHGVVTGELRAIGALQRAELAFYDQSGKRYEEHAIAHPVELLSLNGNVSRRDGRTAVHAHAVVSEADGSCRGGHALPGCIVFACELVLEELEGAPLVRGFDEVTGLPLWVDV